MEEAVSARAEISGGFPFRQAAMRAVASACAH